MNQLPSGYYWGIAKRSRYTPKPPRHLVTQIGSAAQVICSGAPALIENSAGKDCRECQRWLAEYERDEDAPHPEDTRVHYAKTVMPSCGGDRTPTTAYPAPNGCDDCSVEPRETHRYPGCPGNQRTAVA